jgi:HAD superfamily hydrolase (TIGR01450 family)
MDGILYHGDTPLAYAKYFLSKISDIPHVFVTNNPTKTPQQVVTKLAKMGFVVPQPEQIITSALVTADWLYQQNTDFRFFAVGSSALHESLARYGKSDDKKADFVVVGEGAGLDYASLTTGINLIIKGGARLVATNPDVNVDHVVNGRHVLLPGGGALVAPFTVATGQEPVVIGKPAPLLFEYALQYLGVAPAQCLMVGDRPDTDIIGAQKMGIQTALVRTGRFKESEILPEGIEPDYDVADLLELSKTLSL